MALTTAERLTVDGVDLKTLAKNVETLAATLTTPSRRGANPVTAGRSGVIRLIDKLHEAPTYTWPIWVRGCDDDGIIPDTSTDRQEFYKRVDELVSLFSKDGVLDVRHTLPDASVRQANLECLTSLNFTTSSISPLGKVSVELQNLDAYWQDTTDRTATLLINATAATTFNGATAPLDDGVYTITGPITNPRITDVPKGSYTQYNGVVAAAQTLIIDAKNWTISGTGFTPVWSALDVVNMAGRLLRLTPASTRTYTPQLTGTATTTATSLKVVGRRKFLLG